MRKRRNQAVALMPLINTMFREKLAEVERLCDVMEVSRFEKTHLRSLFLDIYFGKTVRFMGVNLTMPVKYTPDVAGLVKFLNHFTETNTTLPMKLFRWEERKVPMSESRSEFRDLLYLLKNISPRAFVREYIDPEYLDRMTYIPPEKQEKQSHSLSLASNTAQAKAPKQEEKREYHIPTLRHRAMAHRRKQEKQPEYGKSLFAVREQIVENNQQEDLAMR